VRPPSPNQAWQKPTGAQFEIQPKPNTRVYQIPTVLSPAIEKKTT